MPRDAYSMMGGLAEMAGDYLDERRMQPPPTDAAWPQQALASPSDPAPWRPEPTRLAKSRLSEMCQSSQLKDSC